MRGLARRAGGTQFRRDKTPAETAVNRGALKCTDMLPVLLGIGNWSWRHNGWALLSRGMGAER